MPDDLHENVRSWRRSENTNAYICFSPYQRQLNLLYTIASPLIETIFGMRSHSLESSSGRRYVALVHDLSRRLMDWRERLPSSLHFNFEVDIDARASLETRAHHLQALALQLTYDNIFVILHRPLLAQQVDSIQNTSPTTLPDLHSSPSNPQATTASADTYEADAVASSSVPNSQQWWDAALRIARVTNLPNVTQLATDSHLVAFLAIILFHSATVMAVCAMSDPLSDRAQEAKRNIARISRLQDLLGSSSTLSEQSSVVLQDIIQMLLKREAEAMFTACWSNGHRRSQNLSRHSTPPSSAVVNVKQALQSPSTFRNPQDSSLDLERSRPDPVMNEAVRMTQSLAFVRRGGFLFYNPIEL